MKLITGHLNPRRMVSAQKSIASRNGCVTLDGNVTNISRDVICDSQNVTNSIDISGYFQIQIVTKNYEMLVSSIASVKDA